MQEAIAAWRVPLTFSRLYTQVLGQLKIMSVPGAAGHCVQSCTMHSCKLPGELGPSNPPSGPPPAARAQPPRRSAAPLEAVPRSRRPAQQGDAIALFPGTPVIGNMCVSHPLAISNFMAAALHNGVSVEATDQRKRAMYRRAGAGASPWFRCCMRYSDALP